MKVLFLVYDKDYAYFPYVNNEKLTVMNLWKSRKQQYSLLAKVFRKLRIPLELWGRFFFSEWMKEIEKYQKVIVFDAVYEPLIGQWLKRKKVNAYIYMWDGKNRRRLSGHQELPVLSFNEKDVEHGMLFQKTFFAESALDGLARDNKYDVFYCGRDKKRMENIEAYCNLLQESGLKTYFHVVSDEEVQKTAFRTTTKELSYREFLRCSAASKAVMNIVDEAEYGTVTLRCLEAIFLEKKLITNDPDVIHLDFYNENNVLILDKAREKEEQKILIRDFMEREYIPVPEQVKEGYRIESFLEEGR